MSGCIPSRTMGTGWLKAAAPLCEVHLLSAAHAGVCSQCNQNLPPCTSLILAVRGAAGTHMDGGPAVCTHAGHHSRCFVVGLTATLTPTVQVGSQIYL